MWDNVAEFFEETTVQTAEIGLAARARAKRAALVSLALFLSPFAPAPPSRALRTQRRDSRLNARARLSRAVQSRHRAHEHLQGPRVHVRASSRPRPPRARERAPSIFEPRADESRASASASHRIRARARAAVCRFVAATAETRVDGRLRNGTRSVGGLTATG